MKYFLIILLFFCFNVQAQKLIHAEDCEVVKPNSQMDWYHSKTQGYNAWTSGSQNPDAQISTHTLKALAAGVEGAPSPLRGTKSYQHKITWIGDNLDLKYSRNELHYGDNCYDQTQTRWVQAAVYLPAGSFHGSDAAPTQIMFDAKFGDSQGPASFSLWVQNSKYVIQQKANHDANETQTIISGAAGDVNYNVWVSWIVDRNFKDDGTGYIKLYKMVHGVDAVKVLVYSHTGPNYLMACGPQSEPYYQMGLYKWNWINGNAGYPVSAVSRGTWIMYTDNIKFWRTSATDADIDADLAGDEGVPGNQQPIVDAGPNQTITLPDTDAVMAASASDPDGTIADYTWTKISGPAGGTISNDDIEDPTITALQEGTYVFQLVVTDNNDAQAVDYITITVESATPPANDGPLFTDVNGTPAATPDTSVLLPTTDIDLVTYAEDQDDGYVVQMLVTQLTGPNTSTVTLIEQAGWPVTYLTYNVSGLIEGTYTYKISAEDNSAAFVYDTISVVVVSAGNDVPVVNAGADQTHPLDGFGAFQTKNTTLNGTTSDPDGTVASVQWIVLSGPENPAFGSPTNDTTTFSGLLPGTYVVRLIATDNNGATAFDDITVRILSVNAGADQTMAFTATTATLTAVSNSVSDTTDVLWTKISGTGGTITSPNELVTGLTGLTQGSYVFQITVTHSGGFIVRDQITVTILTEGNYRRYIKGTP